MDMHKDTKVDNIASNEQTVNNELSGTADKSNEPKTFFDWTEAILLPLVLALLGASFTAAQFMITSQREDADSAAKAIETREQVLTDYGKTIAELVTEYNLGKNSDQGVNNIAKGQTLIALRRLNVSDENDQGKDNEAGKLKGLLIRYLYDAQLIGYDKGIDGSNKKPQIIDLYKANINNVVLEEAWLLNINLSGTELKNGNFKNTYLKDANLMRANLTNADLTDAYLGDADLMKANLRDANLTAARLTSAYLRGAYLANAKFTPEIIKKACYWEEAIYVPVTKKLDHESDEVTPSLDRAFSRDSEEYKQQQRERAANRRKIDEMKQDKASDPKQQPDCSKW